MKKKLIFVALLFLFAGCLSTTEEAVKENTLSINHEKALNYNGKSISEIYTNVIDVKSNGKVKGDGITDDADAVQSILSSAKQNTMIVFPKGNYMFGKPILIDKPFIAIKGVNARIIYKPIAIPANIPLYSAVKDGKIFKNNVTESVFIIKGELVNSPISFTNTSLEGTSNVKLNSSSSFVKGDLVLLSSQAYGKKILRNGVNLSFYREQNFITKVSSVTTGAITVGNKLTIPMLLENSPKAFKINPLKNIYIADLTIEIDKNVSLGRAISGISFVLAADSLVERVSIKNSSQACLSLEHCYNIDVTSSALVDSTSFSSGTGFGVELERSHFCNIKSNSISNHRHGVIFNHGNSNNVVDGNRVENIKVTASIDMHGEFNYSNTVSNNTIDLGKTGIVLGGGGDVHYNDGPYNKVIKNTITRCGVGIEVKNETPLTVLEGNVF